MVPQCHVPLGRRIVVRIEDRDTVAVLPTGHARFFCRPTRPALPPFPAGRRYPGANTPCRVEFSFRRTQVRGSTDSEIGVATERTPLTLPSSRVARWPGAGSRHDRSGARLCFFGADGPFNPRTQPASGRAPGWPGRFLSAPALDALNRSPLDQRTYYHRAWLRNGALCQSCISGDTGATQVGEGPWPDHLIEPDRGVPGN
jgi:hypothetical protein